jgi:hypothetical protein
MNRRLYQNWLMPNFSPVRKKTRAKGREMDQLLVL